MDQRLYQALKKGHIASLREQLQKNPRCLHGITAQKNTVLHVAAGIDYMWSLPEILEIFDHPPLQFAVNSRGDTPLHFAARAGQTLLANFLIDSARRSTRELRLHELRNECGNTPLHEAARHSHLNIAYELIKADVRLGEVINEFGESAIYSATERGAVNIVRMLLQFPTCAVSGPNGQTALHAAVCRNYEIARLLLQARPKISHQVDASQSSPSHYAASIGNLKMIQLLLNHDATTAYLLDKEGLSPIHVAASMGYIDIITEFINYCPDSVELTDKKGRNFLHAAIVNKRTKVVKYALENHALSEVLNEQDNEGNTPLHIATISHNLEIVYLLLADKRIDPTSRSHKGLTPLDLASSCVDSSIRLRMVYSNYFAIL